MAEPNSPVFSQDRFVHREFILGAGDTSAMPLPIWHDGVRFISRWKFTAQELEIIARTGEVLISVEGAAHPPVCVFADDLEVRGNCLVSRSLDEGDSLERLAKL